jgi:hypothetical protein
MIDTVRRGAGLLALAVMAPFVVAHETAHAVAGLLAGGDVNVDSVVPPRLAVSYPTGTPQVAAAAVQLAPTVAGLAVAPLALPILARQPVPVAVYGGLGLLLVVVPSADDVRGLRDLARLAS